MLAHDCPLDDVEFVAFDLETTGCAAGQSEIVEIGAIRFRLDGTEVDRFAQLINPRCNIPREVIRVHGITNAAVADQPPLPEVLPKFAAWLDRDGIGMAHNARFDVSFLNHAYDRCGLESPGLPVIDTVRLARQQLRSLYRHSLFHLVRHYNVAELVEHRAVSDALVLKEVFLRLLHEETPPATVGELFSLAPARFLQPQPASTSQREVPHDLLALEQAVERRQTVSLLYHSVQRGMARRSITPRRFIRRKGLMYLIGYCHADRKEKHYRIDRIQEFTIDAG